PTGPATGASVWLLPNGSRGRTCVPSMRNSSSSAAGDRSLIRGPGARVDEEGGAHQPRGSSRSAAMAARSAASRRDRLLPGDSENASADLEDELSPKMT